jgi:hypothetical protein
MCKKLQIISLVVVYSIWPQVTSAETGVTHDRNKTGSYKRMDPLTSFFGGLGLIGIGMWMNHKNKV